MDVLYVFVFSIIILGPFCYFLGRMVEKRRFLRTAPKKMEVFEDDH